jgi:hypothetical protein
LCPQTGAVSEIPRMKDTITPTLIQTRFSFASTAAEVIDGIDLSGKRAIAGPKTADSLIRNRQRSLK